MKVTSSHQDSSMKNMERMGLDGVSHWIGLRENLQETPIFNGKNHGFL
jgi:hypothetical protein